MICNVAGAPWDSQPHSIARIEKDMSKMVLPKDNQINRTGSGGIALLHYAIDYEYWEFRQETGEDRGRDCVLEYIDENNWHNHIIQGQVKGTKTPESYLLKDGKHFSYKLEKKYINYALRSSNASVLFFCDLKNDVVYYLPIQDYFIKNPDKYVNLLNAETETMKLHIPVSNIVRKNDDSELCRLANATYLFKDGKVVKI